jgi:glutamine synthetase adenylyltransferase
MAKVNASANKRGPARGKKATKRKRFGKTGADTRQAKASQRAAAGTKQARQAARLRLLREIRSLAVAAVDALDLGDLDTVRAKLTTIAMRMD